MQPMLWRDHTDIISIINQQISKAANGEGGWGADGGVVTYADAVWVRASLKIDGSINRGKEAEGKKTV